MKIPASLLILSIILLLSGCSDYSSEVILESVDPLQKVFPESAYFPEKAAHADVARGEHASFQFVVRSGMAIKNLKITTDVPAMGASSPAEVKTGFVGFVPVDRPTPNPGRDYLKTASGYYPDPILDDSLLHVPPVMTQPVWVTVKIPRAFTRDALQLSVKSITGRFNVPSLLRLRCTLRLSTKRAC
jgi:hypothetical protein